MGVTTFQNIWMTAIQKDVYTQASVLSYLHTLEITRSL